MPLGTGQDVVAMFDRPRDHGAFAHAAQPVRAFHIHLNAGLTQRVGCGLVCGHRDFAARPGQFQGKGVVFIFGLFG